MGKLKLGSKTAPIGIVYHVIKLCHISI